MFRIPYLLLPNHTLHEHAIKTQYQERSPIPKTDAGSIAAVTVVQTIVITSP